MQNLKTRDLLAAALVGGMVSAVVLSGVYQRWENATQYLLGTVGILPFIVGVVTVWYLARNAQTASKALENTQAQLEHARQAEVAGRFQKGLEMLGNENEATRIGGLYMLRDVVVASPKRYWRSVVDSLLPFIVARCSSQVAHYWAIEDADQHGHPTDEESFTRSPADIVIALGLITAQADEVKHAVRDEERRELSLAGVVLCNVAFENADFIGASFAGAFLQSVTFERCTLDDVDFSPIAGNVEFDDCSLRSSEIAPLPSVMESRHLTIRTSDLSDSYLRSHRSPAQIDMSLVEDAEFEGTRIAITRSWYFERAPRHTDQQQPLDGVYLVREARWRDRTKRGLAVFFQAPERPSDEATEVVQHRVG